MLAGLLGFELLVDHSKTAPLFQLPTQHHHPTSIITKPRKPQPSHPDLAFLRATRLAMAGGGASSSNTWNFTGLDVAAVAAWLRSPPPPSTPDSSLEEKERERDHLEARKAAANELRLIKTATVTLVTSPTEAELVRTLVPRVPLAVVSNIHAAAADGSEAGIDSLSSSSYSGSDGSGSGSSSSSSKRGWLGYLSSRLLHPQHSHRRQQGLECAARSGALFVGNFNHLPNQQAVATLIRDVLPRLAPLLSDAERAEFTVHLVGGNAPVEADAAGGPVNVVVHGWLPDAELALLYGSVRLVVAPLLSGAGVKGKVNQAMLKGVPVVVTPIAAEGMFLTDGVDALVAATPQAFAEKMAAVARNCALWERLAEAGRGNVEARFSVAGATRAIADVLSRLGFRVPAPREAHYCGDDFVL